MNAIEEKCLKKGVRLTDQRKTIAKVISESKEVYGSRDHPDVDELHKRVTSIDNKFSIIVNIGPGSFSSIRTSLSVAKGMKISKNINLYGFKNSDLKQFDLANLELLISKNLMQNKLIKPIYLS